MTVRWGILGVGDIVRKRVAAAITQNADSQLLAACRRDAKKLNSFCEEYEVPRGYSDAADLLNDDEIDAVYIATPVDLHHPQTVAAAAAGKHVLVEKPMALNGAQCDSMIGACRENHRLLGVAYYRRFYPVVDRIKQLMADGTIGEPRLVSATTCNPFRMQPGDEGFWRVLEAGGGGALMDIGSHRIDLFLDLLGDVKQVSAWCDTKSSAYEADDCTTVSLRFSNGSHAVLNCHFGAEYDPDEFTVLGSRGRLVTSPLNEGNLTIYTDETQRVEFHPPADNLHAPLIDNFVDAIEQNLTPCISGEEGRKTSCVIDLAYNAR